MSEQKNVIENDLLSRLTPEQFLVKLDVADKEINIRPFEHGDSKAFLQILSKYKGQKKPKGFQKEIVFAQKNLLQRCIIGDVTGDKISVENLAIADFVKVMIELKRVTTGEQTPLRYKCVNPECEDETLTPYIKDFVFNVNECELQNIEMIDKNIVEVENGNDTMKFHMKPYTFKLMYDNIDIFSSEVEDQDKINGFYADFIEAIEFSDKTYDNLPRATKIEFLNKLSPKKIKKIVEYVDEQPKWFWEKKWECPVCGAKNKSTLKEISDFFLLL